MLGKLINKIDVYKQHFKDQDYIDIMNTISQLNRHNNIYEFQFYKVKSKKNVECDCDDEECANRMSDININFIKRKCLITIADTEWSRQIEDFENFDMEEYSFFLDKQKCILNIVSSCTLVSNFNIDDSYVRIGYKDIIPISLKKL